MCVVCTCLCACTCAHVHMSASIGPAPVGPPERAGAAQGQGCCSLPPAGRARRPGSAAPRGPPWGLRRRPPAGPPCSHAGPYTWRAPVTAACLPPARSRDQSSLWCLVRGPFTCMRAAHLTRMEHRSHSHPCSLLAAHDDSTLIPLGPGPHTAMHDPLDPHAHKNQRTARVHVCMGCVCTCSV